MSVLIVDYGAGNLGSVERAFEECGADVFVSDSPDACADSDHIVLPGVGAFADGMNKLREGGWVDALCHAVRQEKIPLLGICLGMQLLVEHGEEGGNTEGLGLIPGKAVRLTPQQRLERIPHMGWNEVQFTASTELFDSIPCGTDFYFVHGYHVVTPTAHIISETPYCNRFVSGIRHGSAHGVQFHPEKSARSGFQLISNFLAL